MAVIIRLGGREAGSNAVLRGGLMENTVIWHGMAWMHDMGENESWKFNYEGPRV